jgi:predicted adenine nucleotide alpha hydrolase (AANH) superfamily ATPase
VEKFRKEKTEVMGYFYNPNIHPFQEFHKRLRAVEVFAEQEKLEVLYDKEYGLDKFIAEVNPYAKTGETKRCLKCYEMRLMKTAQKAKELGCDEFTSTLIISPQQKQNDIKRIGAEISKSSGIKFRYEEVTELYPKSKEMAKKRMLYRQQYCGCIFSEAERYQLKPQINTNL